MHTCGIRIDFYTDSPSMTVSVGEAGKYEVMIDNLTAFVQTFEGQDTFSMALGNGNKRVTIVLPSHTPGVIRSVELADGASVAPIEYPVKIAFYGDSITQGSHSEKDSQSYAWLVTRYYDADSLILGVGGATYFPDTVEANGFDPDIVIIALGTNDFEGEQTMDVVRGWCSEYLDRLCALYPDKMIFYVTPIWRADDHRVTKVGKFEEGRQIVRDAATAIAATVIEGDGMIPHLREVCSDAYLHPNDYGFKFYANALYDAILAHLGKE